MVKIFAPNREYTGISAGVTFCNGVGETDNPRIIEWFINHGYSVDGSVEAPEHGTLLELPDELPEELPEEQALMDDDIDPEQAPVSSPKKKVTKKASE